MHLSHFLLLGFAASAVAVNWDVSFWNVKTCDPKKAVKSVAGSGDSCQQTGQPVRYIAGNWKGTGYLIQGYGGPECEPGTEVGYSDVQNTCSSEANGQAINTFKVFKK